MSRVVIVGGGQAGFSTAAGLRSNGYRGEIVILTAENHMPYQRPPLSKSVLLAAKGIDDILLGRGTFYDRNEVEVRQGSRVTTIDCANHYVTIEDNEMLSYDTLVLALGAENRRLSISGSELPNVLDLRTYDDAVSALSWLEKSERVAIIGGGFVGLELASAARQLGRHTTVIEAADRLMARTVSPEISKYYLDLHRGHGVDIQLGTMARFIHSSENACSVETTGGTAIDTDLVFVGVGIQPVDNLAAEAGIATDDGILVDGRMRTSMPDVYAVGDCARFPSRNGRLIRIESVQNATDQGLHAAMDITGKSAAYSPVHWFWSDQFGVKLQMASTGWIGAERRIVGDIGSGRFTVYAFDGDLLTGAESVGRPADYVKARKLLERGASAIDIFEN